jgi:hypothetical protein
MATTLYVFSWLHDGDNGGGWSEPWGLYDGPTCAEQGVPTAFKLEAAYGPAQRRRCCVVAKRCCSCRGFVVVVVEAVGLVIVVVAICFICCRAFVLYFLLLY